VSKPDSVVVPLRQRLRRDDITIYLCDDISHLQPRLTRCPQTLGTRVKRLKRTNSEVAAGGIARFTSTRLCCSQILSIQDLFQTSFSGIKV
jgi:hypothetical protein